MEKYEGTFFGKCPHIFYEALNCYINFKKILDCKQGLHCIKTLGGGFVEIKEVENLLSVSRSNIRFYEKEGLITPERGA